MLSKLGDDLKATLVTPPDELELWIAGLSDVDRKDLFEYAADRRVFHSAFHAVLKSHGCPAGVKKLTDWRRANGFTG